uniref:ATP synthase complex subunit 8 n=1 Tax=Scolytinae sp. BMNH 1040065 TaxID=1903779 RepID=A0A343A531_9CUCU|nr:ATP synthase F0 subunit 8 [Scolytinae sp. BMNH 1040065]
MPQMAPISWMSLYLFFSLLFFMSCILNFYIFMYIPKTTSSKKNKTPFHWKW